MSAVTIQLKILDPRIADCLPAYATELSACVDLRACINEPLVLEADQQQMVSSGIALNLRSGSLMAMMAPRSGLGSKGLVLGNTVGLIDGDYQGPIMMALWNRGKVPITINPMDRIVQMAFVQLIHADFKIVPEFETTARGEGGFGSTGRS